MTMEEGGLDVRERGVEDVDNTHPVWHMVRPSAWLTSLCDHLTQSPSGSGRLATI